MDFVNILLNIYNISILDDFDDFGIIRGCIMSNFWCIRSSCLILDIKKTTSYHITIVVLCNTLLCSVNKKSVIKIAPNK